MTTAADRSEMMRQLAHEIQAPITSLELRLLALKQELPGNELAESCLQEIASMKRLVTSFLELDAPALAPTSSALAPVFAAVESRFRPIAEAAGVGLYMDDGGLTAVCDARASERILSNLVDNAIKFSRGKGRVDVAARAKSGSIDIEVRDDGIGLTADASARVFEPFYRVDREAPGTGLGLAICKALAEAQHGSIRCESELGGGTSFVLTLPATCQSSSTR
jgi:signal transduction histidine kinase